MVIKSVTIYENTEISIIEVIVSNLNFNSRLIGTMNRVWGGKEGIFIFVMPFEIGAFIISRIK